MTKDLAVFGPSVAAPVVEAAVVDTLREWLPTYLAWQERVSGRARGWLRAPRAQVVTSGTPLDRRPEEQLPVVVVTSTGLAEPPVREGSGAFRCWWAIGVGTLAGGRDEDEARDRAAYYAAAVRGVLLQRPALGGVADGVVWLDEELDVIERKRTLAGATSIFRVATRDVVSARHRGPLAPLEDPYAVPDGPADFDDVAARVAPRPLSEG